MGEVLIASTSGVEFILTASLVDATVEAFTITLLPNHTGDPKYAATEERHQLLMENAALIKIDLSRRQNSYLRIILPPEQYARISNTPFFRPPNPRITATTPKWNPPGKKKRLFREHKEKRHMYNECRVVENALNKHLNSVFE